MSQPGSPPDTEPPEELPAQLTPAELRHLYAEIARMLAMSTNGFGQITLVFDRYRLRRIIPAPDIVSVGWLEK